MMFSEERVTQMSAYLLMKRGGRMAYIKLIKLLYLAERQAMLKWGESISGDNFVSMPHGPVLSQTYDLIKGHVCQDGDSPWESLIRDEDNYEVSLSREVSTEDLDELSSAEIDLLDNAYASFGHMSRFEIVDYTHDNCPEWTDPDGSSFPISPKSMFLALTDDEDKSGRLLHSFAEQKQLDQIKASL